MVQFSVVPGSTSPSMGTDFFGVFDGSVFLGEDRSLTHICRLAVREHVFARLTSTRAINCVAGAVSGSSEKDGPTNWLLASTDNRGVD